jgi:hypothetical protein
MDGTLIAAIAGPAGMALVAWYLITKTLPTQQKAFTEALSQIRKDNHELRATIDKMRDAQVESSKLEADAVVVVGTRLTRIEAALVAQSRGQSVMTTGVGLVPADEANDK